MLLAAFIPVLLAVSPDYVLGPDDHIRVWILGMEEVAATPLRVDSGGHVDVPVAGRVRVAGLTLEQFKADLKDRLKKELKNPEVSVTVSEFGSQPVSVVGAVTTAGVHQLRGRKSLAEVIALAGGLKPDAGCCIRITRNRESDSTPLPGAAISSDGNYATLSLRVKDFLEAKTPAENIPIRPHDVITVPTAEMVYVMGAVRKPGAFVLHEKENVSVLQALSLAEGLGPTPAPKVARILRSEPASRQRVEIPVDVSRIMEGKAEDLAMRPNDILFIPTSNSKKAAIRAVEALIYATTGVIIWRR
jgi:polysaccharide export outer membrane protein